MRRLASSVRVRVTFAVTIVFAAFLSAGAYGLVRQVSSALVNDIQVRSDTVTDALSRVLASGEVLPQSLTSSTGPLGRSLGDEFDSEVVREGIEGSYVFVTGPAVEPAVDPRSGVWSRLAAFVDGVTTPLFGKALPGDLSPDDYVVSQSTVQTPSGSLVLTVASSLRDVQRTVSRVSTAMLIATPAIVLMVGILAWLMIGRALLPVSSITRRVNEITASTLHERVPEPTSSDEVGQLARTMNAMLDRLEGSVEAQKRFMSDASHELRSPVASIRMQLETALLAPELSDWRTIARTVLHEDERLAALVDNMLMLSRLEEAAVRSPVEVDLDEIVFDQTSRPTDHRVDRSRVGAGRVIGVSSELASVVRNLFDNAVRHARSTVAISLTTQGDVVRLVVEDDGPGVAEEDRDRVFERFARLQEGRARDSGGSGLGLALCRQIVEVHDGTIAVGSSPLGGARFEVRLPTAPGVHDEGDPGRNL